MDFYQDLRRNISLWLDRRGGRAHRWTSYIMLAPDLFHLLVRLSLDGEVPSMEKAKLAAVTAYFISPFDILPELFLGTAGFLDDVVLTAYVLNSIISKTSPEVVKNHWAGDEDILDILQTILRTAERMLGGRTLARLKKIFSD